VGAVNTLLRNDSDSESGTGLSGLREDEVSEVGSEAVDNPLIPGNDYSSGFNSDYHQPASSKSTGPSLRESYKKVATPLHLAVKGGLVKNVKLLLEHGSIC
jgi:hypothetical protein